MAGATQGDKTLLTYKRPFAGVVGGVPVYGEAIVKFEADYAVDAKVSATAQAGIDQRTEASAGVRYENSTWSKEASGTPTVQPRGPTFSAESHLNVKLGVKPTIALKFYKALTAELEFTLTWLTAELPRLKFSARQTKSWRGWKVTFRRISRFSARQYWLSPVQLFAFSKKVYEKKLCKGRVKINMPGQISLNIGDTFILPTATVLDVKERPLAGAHVIYQSLHPAVATVDEKGSCEQLLPVAYRVNAQ